MSDTIKTLRQVDRDLQTARELLRHEIQAGGQTVDIPAISVRIQAAQMALAKIATDKAGA